MNWRDKLCILLLILILGSLLWHNNQSPQEKVPMKMVDVSSVKDKKMKVNIAIEEHVDTPPAPKPQLAKPVVKANSAKKKMSGGLPPVTADYSSSLGFSTYARMMEQRGALFLMKSRNRAQLMQLKVGQGRCQAISVANLQSRSMSARIRRIDRESSLSTLVTQARGQGAYGEVFMLVPSALEKRMAAQLYQSSPVDEVLYSLKGEYYQRGDSLFLRVRQLRTGKKRLKVSFDIEL